MAHFEIRDLDFSYASAKGRKSLSGVDLTIEKGQYVVVCGKSGSGKTTLLRHLKPVLAPAGKRSGEILFNGKDIGELTDREQAELIGYVMQDPDDQIVTDKVWHELAFGLESLGCDQKTMRARVSEMACYFGIQNWFHRDVAELSGGQKQLLNLASVMAMHPQVLILDEPTSQLDPIAASDFLNTVRKINLELGTTVIITEHRLEDILPYADRAIVMDSGRIIEDDVPSNIGRELFLTGNEMFHAMPTPVRSFYLCKGEGECPLTVRDGRGWLDRVFPNGAAVRSLPETETDYDPDDTVLSMKEVWFRYGRDLPDILTGVSCEIPKGVIYAIVGGNGSGKSTTLKTMCGINRAYRGKVEIFGKKIDKYKGSELFDHCMAMLPQDPKSLFVKRNVMEELKEMSKDEARIKEVASLCEITSLLDSHPYDLSGGEQQRAALAKVLLTEPRILLLDEPTKGLDSFFKETFAAILNDLKKQGITVVMVSHDVEFCARYSDMVSMFFDGQIITTDSPKRFFGSNSFYTTAANRMSRHIFDMAVSIEDVVELYRLNRGGERS